MLAESKVDGFSHSAFYLAAEVEQFIYAEAELLDRWQLDEWLALFTEDAISQIPSLSDPTLNPKDSLFLLADDAALLKSRVHQLLGGRAWAESPRSKTCRLITNVRARPLDEQTVSACANFHVHKSRHGQSSSFFGEYRYCLKRYAESFRIAERTVILAHDELRQGQIGFIL